MMTRLRFKALRVEDGGVDSDTIDAAGGNPAGSNYPVPDMCRRLNVGDTEILVAGDDRRDRYHDRCDASASAAMPYPGPCRNIRFGCFAVGWGS